MDIHRVINQLRLERNRIDNIIKAIETLGVGDPSGPRRRGRKFMDDRDRKAVSERMKRYWEQRRNAKPGEAQTSSDKASSAAA